MAPSKRLRVLHSSDLHGQWRNLEKHLYDTAYDVWLDTGDFLPDIPGFWTQRTSKRMCEGWQEELLEEEYDNRRWHSFAEALGGRPVLTLRGNHDFTRIGPWLKKAGANVIELGRLPFTELNGFLFAGYEGVMPINGRWWGEVEDDTLRGFAQHAFRQDPDVLVTHGPPAGILSRQWGSPSLTSLLAYDVPENLRYHFFGHIHEHGGETMEVNDITFVNGARRVRLHEICKEHK